MTSERRWACMHDKKPNVEGAPEPCGKVAFFALVPPVPGMLCRSRDFLKSDGTPIMLNEEIKCGGCGVGLDMRFATAMLTILEEQ